FIQSDPNPLDPNRDLLWVKNWVRKTGEPMSFTPQQIKQLREVKSQGLNHQHQVISSIIQTPETTPNASASIWNALISVGNTSFVFQVLDAFHYIASEETIKLELIESRFKIDPDYNVADAFLS
ncbi:14783_t:CDS:1, partial [Racocetra persica]